MSDVEHLAYARAKLARIRGYFSRDTYDSINNALNAAKGELDSLKTRCGTMVADCEMLNAKILELQAENNMLRESLASKSVADVDAQVVQAAIESAPECTPVESVASVAIHSIETETVKID